MILLIIKFELSVRQWSEALPVQFINLYLNEFLQSDFIIISEAFFARTLAKSLNFITNKVTWLKAFEDIRNIINLSPKQSSI